MPKKYSAKKSSPKMPMKKDDTHKMPGGHMMSDKEMKSMMKKKKAK